MQKIQKQLKKMSPKDRTQTETQMLTFIKNYQLKQITYKQILQLYRKHALAPQFRTTMYSAVIMLTMPSLTNLYYTFRPNGTFARVMPFAVPVVCVVQYCMAMRYDLENFCFLDTDDSAVMRQKYLTLKKVELEDFNMDRIQKEILAYEKLRSQRKAKQVQ